MSDNTKRVTIVTRQMRDWIQARATIERTGDAISRLDLTGRMLREDIVDGRRYLAVRWKGQGVATYECVEIVGTWTYVCVPIHFGL